MLSRLFLAIALLGSTGLLHAQTDSNSNGDLGALLSGDASTKTHEYTTATFKGVRVINGQSIENEAPGVLNFIILHRFGTVQNGFQDLFGLDGAQTRFGFEYGITKWLTVGLGRSSFEKEYDGLLRAKILRQTMDDHMPITVSYAVTMMAKSNEVHLSDSTKTYYFSNRLSYCHQILIARKFSERFSLQLSPSLVHYNLVNDTQDPNNVLALGIGGRVKLTRRLALTGEYFYQIPGNKITSIPYYNSFSVGLDIETGGHVFQLHFTNSTGITERAFIGQTTDSWAKKGGVHLGFNISRVFTIVKPQEFR